MKTLEPSFSTMNDKELFELCKRYGTSALLWRQKFVGLLPEVNRRRLYERKGFSTVFDFAFKLCGLSEKQVRLALNLKNRFEDMPTLKRMLEEGEVSINKLARIVSIATPGNEEELAEKVRVLPARALETLVRDEKQNGFQKPLFGGGNLHVQTFRLADDVSKELEELHSKGIDVNELLRKMLNQRKEEIEKKKEEIASEIQDEQEGRNDAREERDANAKKGDDAQLSASKKLVNPVNATTKPSRYIPAKVKKIIKEEHGTKCSIPTCQKPAEVIHHTQTFSLSHSHDPRFLAPLCKEHHLIAHSMDIKYHEIRQGAC